MAPTRSSGAAPVIPASGGARKLLKFIRFCYFYVRRSKLGPFPQKAACIISEKVFSHTCLVCAVFIATATFIGCDSNDKSATEGQGAVTEKAAVEKGKAIQVSDLPSTFLETVETSSDSAVTNTLKSRVPLVLDNTTLTIGPVGGNLSVTLATSKLTLKNGVRIITNGNNLALLANEMDFNGSGGIDSFSSDTPKTTTGKPGSDGGRVEIYATKAVFGSIRVSLASYFASREICFTAICELSHTGCVPTKPRRHS